MVSRPRPLFLSNPLAMSECKSIFFIEDYKVLSESTDIKRRYITYEVFSIFFTKAVYL